MKYPTMAAVNIAGAEELAQWYRFLPSPGISWIGLLPKDQWEEKMQFEKAILDRVVERFNEQGGFTPELSKRVGWDEPTNDAT